MTGELISDVVEPYFWAHTISDFGDVGSKMEPAADEVVNKAQEASEPAPAHRESVAKVEAKDESVHIQSETQVAAEVHAPQQAADVENSTEQQQLHRQSIPKVEAEKPIEHRPSVTKLDGEGTAAHVDAAPTTPPGSVDAPAEGNSTQHADKQPDGATQATESAPQEQGPVSVHQIRMGAKFDVLQCAVADDDCSGV